MPVTPTLDDAAAIAAYVEATTPGEVDVEFVEECFRGAAAYLRRVRVEDLRPGDRSSHLEVLGRARLYASLPAEGRPPIVVEAGEVRDGHHRLRDAIRRGETDILAYEVVDADQLERHRPQAELVELQWWWMATSKVRDEEGRPLAVYHGTSADFDEFAPNPRGLFFALAPEAATPFSLIRKGRPRVLQAYLRIENPWPMVRYADDVPYSRMVDQTPQALAAQGYDGIWCPDDSVWIAFTPDQVRIADPDVRRPRELCQQEPRRRERQAA